MDYSYVPLYYDHPVQVRYLHGSTIEGGIAYQDIIIDGATGEISAIQTVINNAELQGIHWDDAIVELDWLSLNSTILNS